jgi:hypothetical protein
LEFAPHPACRDEKNDKNTVFCVNRHGAQGGRGHIFIIHYWLAG